MTSMSSAEICTCSLLSWVAARREAPNRSISQIHGLWANKSNRRRIGDRVPSVDWVDCTAVADGFFVGRGCSPWASALGAAWIP